MLKLSCGLKRFRATILALVLLSLPLALVLLKFSSHAADKELEGSILGKDVNSEVSSSATEIKINRLVHRNINNLGHKTNRQPTRHNERQTAVVDMFKHAWKGYREFAWGKDELLPLVKEGNTTLGLGLTIVDSLDTMWLMGLTEEFHEAREWVANNLDIAGNHHEVSVFETNIRILGGLLAAYHLSKDGVFLQKAVS